MKQMHMAGLLLLATGLAIAGWQEAGRTGALPISRVMAGETALSEPVDCGGEAFMRGDYQTTFRECLQLAEAGIPEAQRDLGWMYYEGFGVPQDYAEGIKWYRKAVEQDDPDAMFYLGTAYHDGRGVPRDYALAMKWYRRGAERGSFMADSFLGEVHGIGSQAIDDDLVSLPYICRTGIPKDGGMMALSDIGEMVGGDHGADLAADRLTRMRQSAERGDASAQFHLGMLYLFTPDVGTAKKWLHLAAEQGDPFAQYFLGSLYYLGQLYQPDKLAYGEAMKWARHAAEHDHAAAQVLLGCLYNYRGRYGFQDHAEAMRWYRKAAELGNFEGQMRLAFMYYQGDGPPPSRAEAAQHIYWFGKAAEQGGTWAQIKLREYYREGRMVPRNLVMVYVIASAGLYVDEEKKAKILSGIAEDMTPAELEQAQQLAEECAARSYEGCFTRQP